MNGRIYDPLLGRFLSADIVVDEPFDLQSYNRYSYVNNRPLSLTDPTGYSPFGEHINRSFPNIDHAMLRKNLGAEKADRVIAGRAKAQTAADKGTMLGGAIVGVTAAAVYMGPVAIAKEVGAEAINQAGEAIGVGPVADIASTRGLLKGFGRKLGRLFGRNADEGAEAALKQAEIKPNANSTNVDVDAPAPKSELHRPYIRKPVRAEVDANAPRTPDGRPIDPNTGKPIDGKPDLGHKTGNEFKREKAKAEAEGLTQEEFNDRMNDPDLYQLEDPSSNRSHRYEKKD